MADLWRRGRVPRLASRQAHPAVVDTADEIGVGERFGLRPDFIPQLSWRRASRILFRISTTRRSGSDGQRALR